MSQSPYQPPKAPLESPAVVEARVVALARRYALGAMAMGALEILDAFLWSANPRDPTSASYLIAVLEIVWAIVSLYALVRIKHPATRLLSGAFVAWMAFGVVVSIFVDASAPPPTWALFVEVVFGVAYLAASIYLRRTLP